MLELQKENLQLKLQLIESRAQLTQIQLNLLGLDHEKVRKELELLEANERSLCSEEPAGAGSTTA